MNHVPDLAKWLKSWLKTAKKLIAWTIVIGLVILMTSMRRGYKGFVKTDASDGYIEVHSTPANTSEVGELEPMMEKDSRRRLFADKGYASESNRQLLRENKMKDGIMHKASRGNPLSFWQLMKNKLISKVRYKVERAFGTLKRKFAMARARYCGLKKVCGELCLKAICFNLNKALRKIQPI